SRTMKRDLIEIVPLGIWKSWIIGAFRRLLEQIVCRCSEATDLRETGKATPGSTEMRGCFESNLIATRSRNTAIAFREPSSGSMHGLCDPSGLWMPALIAEHLIAVHHRKASPSARTWT